MNVVDLASLGRPHRIDIGLELSDDERALALATWRGRMHNEHASARVFAGLVPQLMRAGIHDERLAEVLAMAREELEHARLCAGVVLGLGGEPAVELGALDDLPAHADATPVEALLRNVLSISCLSETVAVAQITAEREQAGSPALRGVLDRILGDEVGHARFGWKLIAALVPELDEATHERLEAYLAVAFRALDDFHRSHGADPLSRPSPAAQAVGVCDGGLQHRILVDTVRDVIVPGLAAVGLASRPPAVGAAA